MIGTARRGQLSFFHFDGSKIFMIKQLFSAIRYFYHKGTDECSSVNDLEEVRLK